MGVDNFIGGWCTVLVDQRLYLVSIRTLVDIRNQDNHGRDLQ